MKPLRLILSVASRAATRSRSSAAATAPPTAAGCPFHQPQEIRSSLTGNVKPFEAIPTPRKLPIIGTMFDIWRSGGAAKMHEYCHSRHLELGPIFRERLGTVDAVVICKKDLIEKVYFAEGRYPQHLVPEAWLIYNEMWGMKRGLFFMDGEQWLKTREELNHAMMSRTEVYKYGPNFLQVSIDLLNRWKELTENNNRKILPNLEPDLYSWSIDSIGEFIYGKRLYCVTPPGETSKMADFVSSIQKIFINSAKLSIIPPGFAAKWNLAPWRDFSSATGFAMQTANDIVKQRLEEYKRTGNYGDGILGYLLSSTDLPKSEITSIINDLLLAAADTTSHAAQWCLYMLAKHPEVQEKLYADIQAVVGPGEMITVEKLDKIPYLNYIINETLRMYPIATFLTRILPTDIVLDNYHIPAGTLILMSQYTVGRDSERFPNPDEFNPDRWKKTGPRGKNTAHCCMPFGIGSRGCVGRILAEVNLRLLMATTVQNYIIKAMNKNDVGISLRLITTPDQPIEISFRKRST